MASSKSKTNSIICRLRHEPVKATPEEIVRQSLIHHMVDKLGYPVHSLVIEKELRQLPHVSQRNIPNRRIDLACVVKGIHPEHELYPLLLVECKAVKLTEDVVQQVVGYNHYLGAYFVAIVNAEEVKTGWYEQGTGKYAFLQRLPAFDELMSNIPTRRRGDAEDTEG